MPNAGPGRRHTLIGLAALAAGPALGAGGATLFVAGPAGGRVDRWADALSLPLARALQQGAPLVRQNAGGADGVTGANQFEALATPDGTIALLVPGSAALSWLGGDTRVRFDAARWVPVWGGSCSAALASRVRLVPGRPVRLAVGSLIGPELAALLALELMGIQAVPVPAAASPEATLLRRDIDAVFLSGSALREEEPVLAAGGMPAMLALGTLDAAGRSMRDPALPDLPCAMEAIGRSPAEPQPGLLAALRAVSAAASLEVALVLPPLCPASTVALWRRACARLEQAQSVQTEALQTGIRPLGNLGLAVSTSLIAAEVPTILELRRWLATRHGWQAN